MFRALLSHPQEAQHKRHSVYCVCIMSVGCSETAVRKSLILSGVLFCRVCFSTQFFQAFEKLCEATIPFVMSAVLPSLRMKQFDYYRNDFH
jgi:hypothetical protein